MALFDSPSAGSSENPLMMLLRQLLGGDDPQQMPQEMPQQTSALPTQRPDLSQKVLLQSRGPVGGAAGGPPSPTNASAFDVFQGRATSGKASNGDIIRMRDDGTIERQSAKYGYSERVPGQSGFGSSPQMDAGGMSRMQAPSRARQFAGSDGQDRLQGNGREGPTSNEGSPIGNMLWKAFDPESYSENRTIQYLRRNGLSEGDAALVAGNREMLNAFITKDVGGRVFGKQPDYQMQTIYDSAGNEQRVLMDMNNPTDRQVIGGAKSSVLSPEEEAQKIRLAQAGRAQTNVNVGSAEGKYDQTIGEGYAKRYLETRDMANNAGKGLNTIAAMRQAMSQPGFYSGTGATAVQAGKRLLSSLGFSDEIVSGVSSMEQFNAMAKQSALDLMGGSLGSGFSNADRDFVTGQVANLGNTPEGNRALLDIQEKVLRRTQEVGRLANDYAKRNSGRIDAGFDEFLADWSQKNPLFPDSGNNQQPWYRRDDQGPTRIRNPEQPAQKWRATNPDTGEAIEWNGSAWVKAR